MDGGGELVLDARPLANAGTTQAGFYYQNSGTPSGTFAFRNPGSTIALPLAGVAIGDSIALPGSDVASVTYGGSSISVVTNLGTTTFTNVSYVQNEIFTGFTTAMDPLTGLEKITFAGYPTTSFQQATTSNVVSNGFTFGVYLWSTPGNWTNGVPANGAGVTQNIIGGGNPSGYDDISSLFLNNVSLTSGFIAVGGAADLSHGASLEVGMVGFGSTTSSIYSDTNLGSPSAALLIDSFANTGTYGRIAATGANAFTDVRSATDPGEIYQVDGGGELLLEATPLANAGTTQAGFYYQNSGTPSGTFAFANPGGTIALPLAGVAMGDSIALPGNSVSSVTYGGSSITVVTNLGTTVFSNVSYFGGTPTIFGAAADPTTGLERITFACFARGTLIATDDGDVAVEDLEVGDLVQTMLSRCSAPITWIGYRHVDCKRHPKPELVWPVRVARGAFGHGRPYQDLLLSPDHAIHIDGVLIPVKHLINGESIAQQCVDDVTYYHIELARHEVVLAQGLPVESYLDNGDRADFANGGGAVRLYPDFSSRVWDAYGCAPLVVTGPELIAARQWVQALSSTARLRLAG